MSGEKRYVSLDAVVSLIEKTADGYPYIETPTESLISQINTIPAADVVELKHGEWVRTDDEWRCSACGEEVTICMCGKDKTWKYSYCPNCGAKNGRRTDVLTMSIGQKLEKIATQEDLFPELSAEEKEVNKTVAKIVTNGDKYRAMTDEEIARNLMQIVSCHRCPIGCKKPFVDGCTCKTFWLDWLKQEVQEDEKDKG